MSGIVNTTGAVSGVIGTITGGFEIEEGNWTGNTKYGSGTVNYETYTKIGNTVTVYFSVEFVSSSGSGQAVQGLPFTVRSSSHALGKSTGGLSIGYTNYTAFCGLVAWDATTQIVGYDFSTATYFTGEILSGKRFDGNISYLVA